MWYNYARSGSPFDFGANYNLTGNDIDTSAASMWCASGPAVFTSLLDLPRLKSVFPFLQETEVTTNAVIRTISEPFVGGMLAATPFTWALGLLALPQTRQSLRRRPGAAGFVWLAVAGMVIITVVDCEMAGVLYRYLMDYSPVPLLRRCAVLAAAGKRAGPPRRRRRNAGRHPAAGAARGHGRRCGVERRLSLLHPFCHPAVAAGTEPLAVL